MTEFYNKYKDLFDGELGPASMASAFNPKGISGASNDQNEKLNNFREFKYLFDEDKYQPKKQSGQYGGGYSKNYYSDSLDDPQLSLPVSKSPIYQDDPHQFASKKPPINYASKESYSFDQFNKQPFQSNQGQQDQIRTNSRQSQKRDTLAANAERLLMQDAFNRNSSANRQNELPQQNTYENPAKLGYMNQYQDNYQNININSNFNTPGLKGNIQYSKPPLQSNMMERFDNQPNKNNRDLYSYSPRQQQQQSQQQLQSVQYNNNKSYNQGGNISSNNPINGNSNPVMKQSESSPVTNVSKQRKYEQLYGKSALHMDESVNNSKNDKNENNQQGQVQNQQFSVPRIRGINENQPQNHYEERNQGLIDILYLKKRFVDHKIINDQTGFPGSGQYREALFNRIKATKTIQERREQLKQLLKKDRVF